MLSGLINGPSNARSHRCLAHAEASEVDTDAGVGEDAEVIETDADAKVAEADSVEDAEVTAPDASEDAKVVEADATTWVPDEGFGRVDVLTFSYSLTMIPNWFSAMDHAAQLLAPDGRLGGRQHRPHRAAHQDTRHEQRRLD